MMILQLSWADNGDDTASYRPANSAELYQRYQVTLDLAPGQDPADLAMGAAEEICRGAQAAGVDLVPAESYTENAPVPPGPNAEPADPLLDQYLAEALAPARIMARWKRYNQRQLDAFAALYPDPSAQPDPGSYDLDDGWSPADYASFAGTIGTITTLLTAQSYGTVAQLVQVHSHPVATPTAKAAYLAAMVAELPSLDIPS